MFADVCGLGPPIPGASSHAVASSGALAYEPSGELLRGKRRASSDQCNGRTGQGMLPKIKLSAAHSGAVNIDSSSSLDASRLCEPLGNASTMVQKSDLTSSFSLDEPFPRWAVYCEDIFSDSTPGPSSLAYSDGSSALLPQPSTPTFAYSDSELLGQEYGGPHEYAGTQDVGFTPGRVDADEAYGDIPLGQYADPSLSCLAPGEVQR